MTSRSLHVLASELKYLICISACQDIRQPRKFSTNVVDVFD